MKITRQFTKAGQDVYNSVTWDKRTSRITNPDGSIVFEMKNAMIPAQWSQLATDIMVSKYFRKAGVPQKDERGQPLKDESGKIITGPETSAQQVIHRLAGCWRYWGESHGYFDTAEDAQAFYDELAYMMLHQMCAPNSPQWFNTGLNWAYGITGPAQGHFYCDPKTGELTKSDNAYSHPQPHACFIQSVSDDLVNPGGIMDLWTREARLFKYGSGTGSNFSQVRGDGEKLAGGGRSSGLMSFLKIGDRAAGAIKSGGTTRRAAKMVCLDLDHPDIEEFINWKVREELKVAALAEGMKALGKDQQELAKKLKLKLDYDFNGEAYATVSGQNSNNSVRIPNSFFKALDQDADWNLTQRTTKKITKTLKAKELWEEIAFAAWRCADPGVQYDSTINQWHTCPQSGRINASNPCVTADTRILTPGGIWRRIDSMIHLPSRLITNVNGKEIHVTEGAFQTGVKPVYELRTESGYTLKLTADHKVWTRRGWVEAENLTTEDEVKLPHFHAAVEEVGEPQDATFFHLVGMLVSNANHDVSALHLDHCIDASHVDEFVQYVNTTFSSIKCNDDFVNEAMLDDAHAPAEASDSESGRSSDHRGGIAIAKLTNRRLISRARAFIKIDSGQVRLSDDAFTAGLAAQKHILRGLFTADAVVDEVLELQSPFIGMLEDVQLLLTGFGIKSKIIVRNTNGGGAVSGGSLDSRIDSADQNAASRHGLQIDPSSLPSFVRHIALLPGKKLQAFARLQFSSRYAQFESWDRVATFTHLGTQPVFDLTEPNTSSFIANGMTVHNCSEYMFLDDTACNLASLNVLTFYDSKAGTFDVEAFKHGTRLWTTVLEISVLMASFPSEAIAQLSYKFRTLGLGYANLGAMLMQSGIPYDSQKGRAICGALTSILTGESYATSAELAKELGAFPGYEENKTDMLRVIRNHRRAAHNTKFHASTVGSYEALDIHPVEIDDSQFTPHDALCNTALLESARETWDRALSLGERYGYRNAQTTVIAPTGTIGLLMDCDTTGVEPDFALVKFKKLAGGGYFKIANQSLEPALHHLGYTESQITDILAYVMGTMKLNGTAINRGTLKAKGFTDAVLDTIEAALPGTFELSFAFAGWTLGSDFMKSLGISDSTWQAPGFNLLRHLGFNKQQIDEANDIVCGRGTVEGAPHLKDSHLPVFDCANRCGKTGQRFIAVEGHIRMMAAAQPFISGAISKTINLPNEATIDDIKQAYRLSWELSLKANALYRDGSKLSQPLNIKSDEDLDKKTEEEDADAVEAAKEEVTKEVATVAGLVASATSNRSDNLAPAETHVVERIIERIVERPLRRRLPDTRHALTHKFDVAGHEGYITVGLYEDGTPGEVFITMAKEGSTIGGLMDCVATLVSVALQYGVPVESLVRKFEHTRFEPNGMTRNPEIPIAKSLVDYIFRWLAMEFVPGYRAANSPRAQMQAMQAAAVVEDDDDEMEAEETESPRVEDTEDKETQSFEFAKPTAPSAPKPAGKSPAQSAAKRLPSATTSFKPASRLKSIDPLSQQGSSMQSDAPACDVCGSITVRSGTCYKCQNCGNSMGCS